MFEDILEYDIDFDYIPCTGNCGKTARFRKNKLGLVVLWTCIECSDRRLKELGVDYV